MSDLDLDFDEVAKLDRKAMLFDAAHRLDALHGHMGSGEKLSETLEGNIVRSLAEDEGTFARTPVVRRITSEEYLGRNLPVPFDVADMLQNYRHYLLEFPFELDPAAGWAFNSLEVRVDFNKDDPAANELPRVFQIFPDPKFQELFKVDAELEVGVKANGEFAAKLAPTDVQVGQGAFKIGADLVADAGARTGFVIGPWSYSVRRAVINHRGIGREWARWEIGNTMLHKGDDPRLMLIVQVPKDTQHLKVRGQLLAKRRFSLANYRLIEALKNLPDTFHRWFEGGTPFHSTKEWDVTERVNVKGSELNG